MVIRTLIALASMEQRQQSSSERVPQWGPAETRELLGIRAELDQHFVETKRNKPLWEAISARMLAKGLSRTPDQCKSKWKNLLTRFKGCEALEGEESRQNFPYYEEMKSILSGREQRFLSFDEKEEKEEEEEGEGGRVKKRKKKKTSKNEEGEVELALKELTKWQTEREERWLQAAESREAERRAAEGEWRRAMEAISEERAEMERTWREREDQRRARQQARSGRHDAVVAAIAARLGVQDVDPASKAPP